MELSATLVYSSPRQLPAPEQLEGNVIVLDIAFAATTGSVSYEAVTLPFIEELGERLVCWVDHHDHERHTDFARDDRFVLSTKAEHGACPEMVTPRLVERVGTVDTIVCHLDLDGLYSAAKWLRRGNEPYEGADQDAVAVDTRKDHPSAIGELIDHALRASFRDMELKNKVVSWLVGGVTDDKLRQDIEEMAQQFAPLIDRARRLAEGYEVKGNVALLEVETTGKFDKTELLLLGQELAPVAVIRHAGMVTAAAAFDSGLDFVKLLDLRGGMPTRISVPESRLQEVVTKLQTV